MNKFYALLLKAFTNQWFNIIFTYPVSMIMYKEAMVIVMAGYTASIPMFALGCFLVILSFWIVQLPYYCLKWRVEGGVSFRSDTGGQVWVNDDDIDGDGRGGDSLRRLGIIDE